MANVGDSSRALMRYFTEEAGLSPVAASGIIGNFMAESELDPTAFNSAGGGQGAAGIGQWRGERQTGLRAFAEELGTESTDLMTQAKYAVHEMQTTHKKAWEALLLAKTPEEAAMVFERDFEKAGGHGMERRVNEAANAAGYYAPYDAPVGDRYSGRQAAIAAGVLEKPKGASPEAVAKANSSFPAALTPPNQVEEPPSSPTNDLLNYFLNMAADEPEAEGEEPTYNRLGEMLIGLGVGLGQMSSGQPVNVIPTLDRLEQTRIADRESRRKAEDTFNPAKAAIVAQQAIAAGIPENIAMFAFTGPEGMKTVMQAVNTKFTADNRAETKDKVVLSPEQLSTLGVSAGLDPQSSALIAQSGEDGQKTILRMIADRAKPTGDDGEFLPEDAMKLAPVGRALLKSGMIPPDMEEIVALAEQGDVGAGQLLSTAVSTASGLGEMRDAAGERYNEGEQEALAAQADALGTPAGQALAEDIRSGGMPATSARRLVERLTPQGNQAATDLATEDARYTRGVERLRSQGLEAAIDYLGPDGDTNKAVQGLVAADAAYQARIDKREEANRWSKVADDAITTLGPTAETIFSNVQSEAQYNQALDTYKERYGKPDTVKKLEAMRDNPDLFELQKELNKSSTNKVDLLDEKVAGLVVAELGESTGAARKMTELANVMRPVYDLARRDTENLPTGMLTGGIYPAIQNLANDLGVDFQILDDSEQMIQQAIQTMQAPLFQNFRAEGSGAMSDFESKQFLSAFGKLTDDPFKVLVAAQAIVKGAERNKLYQQYYQEAILERKDDIRDNADFGAAQEYAEKMLAERHPEINSIFNIVEDPADLPNDVARRGEVFMVLDPKTNNYVLRQAK